ncbi:leucine-rich repeat-containing protein 40-like [Diachasmimorpha longicaudata]|uniref:leucine-rich repeat-containing protein 40-like n=1 Tax=Diachasmimorpha longicaudata TaxID=58733 RepID=UPI0030B8BEFB
MSVERKMKVNHRALFKPRCKNDDDDELSERIIIDARRSGELNLAGKGLATVPQRIWTINQLSKGEVEELGRNLDFDDDKERWWEQEPLKKLNLSENSIKTIDSDIDHLSEIEELDFHDNLLEEVPKEIGALIKLRKFDISHNNLGKISKRFFTLENLKQLNLSHNNLADLDPAIGDLVMLESLNLSFNNLTTLPVGLGYLVRLCTFDVSHNLLVELPPDIMSMRVLKKLDANSNHLEVVPPLGEMRKLEALILHTNNLKNFPNITGCTALKELNLSNNSIDEIDMECLEDMGQLRSLLLAHNNIEVIPDDIIKLLNMERLDLSSNKLTLIPNFICIMPNLKHFIINGNEKIKNVRRDIVQCGTPRILKHLRQGFDSESLDVHSSPSTGPVSAPDKYTMRNTKLLSLTAQHLHEVPDDVLEDAKIAGVTCIDISKNKLCQVPEKLSAITSVEDMKISCNQLASLPEWFGEPFKHLRYIDLSQNQLSALPKSIGELERLREINISCNRFTKIPESVCNIENLEILIMNDNHITDIDVTSLLKLRRLATLDLSNNDIGHVPPELGNMKNIRMLMLSGNYFKQPRHAILERGTEEILSYLRSRISS